MLTNCKKIFSLQKKTLHLQKREMVLEHKGNIMLLLLTSRLARRDAPVQLADGNFCFPASTDPEVEQDACRRSARVKNAASVPRLTVWELRPRQHG